MLLRKIVIVVVFALSLVLQAQEDGFVELDEEIVDVLEDGDYVERAINSEEELDEDEEDDEFSSLEAEETEGLGEGADEVSADELDELDEEEEENLADEEIEEGDELDEEISDVTGDEPDEEQESVVDSDEEVIDDLDTEESEETASEISESDFEEEGGEAIIERLDPEPEEEVFESAESTSYSQSEPNYEFENQLHNIYLNYHSSPTSEAEWVSVVGNRFQEVYTVQRGDTLWDISSQIFGDGFYWTKLWSYNASIENPHRIEPGMQVRFALGTDNEAPAMTVVQAPEGAGQESSVDQSSESEIVKQEKEEEEEEVADGQILIPPPSKTYNPVLNIHPATLPQWTGTRLGGNYDEDGISIEEVEGISYTNELFITSFVREDKPQALGDIVENESGSKLASLFQYIYIDSDEGLSIGSTYNIVRNRGALENSSGEVKELDGYNIQLQGKVKIEGEVKGGSGTLYRGIIVESYSPIDIGSILIGESLGTKVLLDMKGNKSDVVAQIIGGEFAVKRKYLGPQSTVFLNRGANDGVSVGDILTVRAHKRLRNLHSKVEEHLRAIGHIKIVDTEENLSTGLVVNSWDGIQTGDWTGGAKVFAVEGSLDGDLDDGELSDESFNEEELGDDDESFEEDEEVDEGEEDFFD